MQALALVIHAGPGMQQCAPGPTFLFTKMKPSHELQLPCARECVTAAPIVQTKDAQENKSSEPIEAHPPARTLKIEEDGDYWKGLTKPKIRLMGRWLERAGFKPGNRVRVTHVAPGVIELRSSPDLMLNETKQQPFGVERSSIITRT